MLLILNFLLEIIILLSVLWVGIIHKKNIKVNLQLDFLIRSFISYNHPTLG